MFRSMVQRCYLLSLQLLSLVALKDGVHLLPALCSEVGRPLAPHLCGAVDQISHVLFTMATG